MDVSPEIVQRLQKIMALTTSPSEGEATAATEMLARLLLQHNLSVADLEQRGQTAPAIGKQGHDLGKAAFRWKLDLANAIADTFYCYPLVDARAKTVAFVGRPENVDSVLRIYAWLIDQIKRIASADRYIYMQASGEHIDPLRWQLQFGEGAVSRLRVRLWELKKAREGEEQVAGLVKHHLSEVSDWMETTFGWRPDGQNTKQTQEYARRHQEWLEQERLRKEARTPEQRAADEEATRQWEAKMKDMAERDRRDREARERGERTRKENYRAKHGYYPGDSPEDRRVQRQKKAADDAGWQAGQRINLTPFLSGRQDPAKTKEL